MEYTLSMVFITEKGAKSSLSISGVKPTLTKTEIDALMDTIIAKNIFLASTGALEKKESAQIVAKTVTKYEMGK